MFALFVVGWVLLCCVLGSVFPIGAVGILLYPLLGGVMFLIYTRVAEWDHDRNAETRRWRTFVEDSRRRLSNQDTAFDHLLGQLNESAERTRRNIRRIMGEDNDKRGGHEP
jgi:hypothetical protein